MAVPSVVEPPVTAPDAVGIVAPDKAPLVNVAVPSVNDPTVTALGRPTVTVPLLDTSTSLAVPEYVIVPPNDIAVLLLQIERLHCCS